MENTRTNTGRTLRPENPNSSDQQDADVVFIADYAKTLSAKEGARRTGMTANGFKKLQSGDNTISYKKMTKWMRGDPDLMAAYLVHVGFILPGEAEFAAAYTRACHAAARAKQARGE